MQLSAGVRLLCLRPARPIGAGWRAEGGCCAHFEAAAAGAQRAALRVLPGAEEIGPGTGQVCRTAQHQRQLEGKTEELSHDSQSRAQLLRRAEQLLARMDTPASSQEARAACVEIKKSAAQFRKDRDIAWELLFKREAAALEGEMKRKREAGKAKLTSDTFGRARDRAALRASATYLAAAEAAEAAAQALACAEAEIAPVGGASDEDEAGGTDAPKAAKKRRCGGGTTGRACEGDLVCAGMRGRVAGRVSGVGRRSRGRAGRDGPNGGVRVRMRIQKCVRNVSG